MGCIQNFLGFFKSIKYVGGSPWSAFGDIKTQKNTQRRIKMKKTKETPVEIQGILSNYKKRLRRPIFFLGFVMIRIR
jgi:hypothetical protein